MRSTIYTLILAIAACGGPAAAMPAAETDALESVAKKIGEQIAEKPQVHAAMYHAGFLKAVPVEKLAGLYAMFFSKYGGVTRMELEPGATAAQGQFKFHFQDVEMPVTLTVEPAEPHLVVGLWFGPPVPRLKSWTALVARLAKLPGDVSFQALQLGAGKPVAEHRPRHVLGIGSAFKLYVLATMADQHTPWEQVMRLEDRHKSLPSGVLSDWPAGSPLTVHTLATEMISISDNTAADHLLALVGRTEVERRLASFGMEDPAANQPFLNMREFFRLKSDAALRKEFLAADRQGRRKLLAGMADLPRLKADDLHWNGPTDIDRIEWLASAANLCRLLAWLDAHGGETALAIMAVNPGKAMPAKRFAYVGYKGGSESGVLSMNWLLHARDGRHVALSAIWNNKAQDVDLGEFMGLMSAAGDLLAATDAPSGKPAAKSASGGLL